MGHEDRNGHVDRNALAAVPVTDVSQLPPAFIARFREDVLLTLSHVFGLDAKTAKDRLQWFTEQDDVPPSLFTYHFTPLQIAAGLASQDDRPLRPDEEARYLEIIRRPFDSDRMTSDSASETCPGSRRTEDQDRQRTGSHVRRAGP